MSGNDIAISPQIRRTINQIAGPVIGAPVSDTLYSRVGVVRGHYTRTQRGGVLWDPLRGGRVFIRPGVPTMQRVAEFRDPMALAGGQPGMLYRSANLTNATISDRLTLSAILRGGSIIDLRTHGRVVSDPTPGIPGVLALRQSLPPTKYVPYAALISNNKERLGEILIRIACSPGPVLVHCTEGKDRTGIVVAITMMVAGFSEASARAEFLNSDSAREIDWNRMVERMRAECGGPAEKWATDPGVGLNLPRGIVARLRVKFNPA